MGGGGGGGAPYDTGAGLSRRGGDNVGGGPGGGQEGYHSFEGTVVEAGEEAESVHFDLEKMMVGEGVLTEEKARDVTMKLRLMKGGVEVKVHY